MSPVIDTSVQPHFRYNAEIRKYLSPTHKLRSIPDVEQQWYQAPGGDYRQDLYGDGYPGSDPDTVARHLFTEGGASHAILNPLTRGNIADYLLNSRICAAVNDWLLDRWLEPDSTGRFLGTIRVNPEDVKGAVAEIERLAERPHFDAGEYSRFQRFVEGASDKPQDLVQRRNPATNRHNDSACKGNAI